MHTYIHTYIHTYVYAYIPVDSTTVISHFPLSYGLSGLCDKVSALFGRIAQLEARVKRLEWFHRAIVPQPKPKPKPKPKF